MGRPKTQNAGAALERQALRAYIRRRITTLKSEKTANEVLREVLAYLDRRIGRNRDTPGGLG